MAALAALPGEGWLRFAAWTAVLAAAGRARKRKPEPAGNTSSPSDPARAGNSDPAGGHRHTGFHNEV